jgi:C4-dicarboxylate transporter DctM subunit
VTMVGALPIEVFYLIVLLIFVVILFVFFKRPIYETMFFAYCFSVVMTGKYDLFIKHLIYPATQSSLFYIIVSFLALAYILGKTKVVEKLINIILSIFGGLPGGAGYVALFGSAGLATMTGTGPGNVAATGVFTIPAMIKSGFSRELAATTEASSSMLGNQMGPGLNLVGFGILAGLYPAANYSLSTFWIALWIVGGWLVVQRLITLIILCKVEGVKPIPREERPTFRKAMKEGWDAIVLPIIILLPIIFSSKATAFIGSRLGEDGSAAFGAVVLMFTVGVCTVYALLTGRKQVVESEGGFNTRIVYNMFKGSLKSVVPVGATIYFAYATSMIFKEVAIADAMQTWIVGLGLGKFGWVVVVVLFTAVLGMVLPGSSQVALLGGAIISTGITGVMEGMTPPLALAMFTAMGIAKSKFWPTAKIMYIWVIGHLLFTILLLMGILPIFIKG